MQNVLDAISSLKGSTLVLTHHNADVDALASALTLAKAINGKAGVAESISRVAKKFVKDEKVLIDPDCSKFDNVILVDTSVKEQLSSCKNLKADIIIDHHPRGKLCDGAVCWIDQTERSTAQMIFKLFKKMKWKIDKKTARLLLAGIVTDTAHLRLAEKKEFEIITELLDKVSYKEILALLQTESDFSEKIACLKAATRANIYKSKDSLVVISEVASHEAAACRSLLRIGADVAIVIAKKKDQLRISSRGKRILKEKGVDLSVLFKEVGKIIGGNGGGHDLAGSANGPDKSNKNQAIQFLIDELSKKLGKLEKTS